MTVTQPQFFPPLYMFQRFHTCRSVVFMQEAQYSVKGNHSRFDAGLTFQPKTFSISLRDRSRLPLDQLFLSEDAVSIFLEQIRNNYSKSPYYDRVYPWLHDVMQDIPMNLFYANAYLIQRLMYALAINCTVFYSKNVIAERPQNPTEWIAELASTCDASNYMQGAMGITAYFDKGYFSQHGMRVWGQNITHEKYNLSYSVLDYLFTIGFEATSELIKSFKDSVYRIPEYE